VEACPESLTLFHNSFRFINKKSSFIWWENITFAHVTNNKKSNLKISNYEEVSFW
jgi:hypothetical protein